MTKFWFVLKTIVALFMIYAGVQHFLNPEFYLPFVPSFLPAQMVIVYISGVIEVIIGLLLLTKKYQGLATYALLLLMLIFLPIHINDVISDTPVIGSKKAAIIRLVIQFLAIALCWKFKSLYYSKSNSGQVST